MVCTSHSLENRTGRALVARARAPCGTPCRDVQRLDLRQQRSVAGRCEARGQRVAVGLGGLVRRQAESLASTWSRLDGKWQAWRAARSQSADIEISAVAIEVDSLAGYATDSPPPLDAPAADLPNTGSDLATIPQEVEPAGVTHRGNGSTSLAQGHSGGAYVKARNGSAQERLASAKEAVKSSLASIEVESRPTLSRPGTRRQFEEPATSSPHMPFVVKPLPWFLGALSPVIFFENHDDASRFSLLPMCRVGQSPLAGLQETGGQESSRDRALGARERAWYRASLDGLRGLEPLFLLGVPDTGEEVTEWGGLRNALLSQVW